MKLLNTDTLVGSPLFFSPYFKEYQEKQIFEEILASLQYQQRLKQN